MIVSFLRHAEAEPDAGRDFDRKLTVKGLEQAEKVGKFLVRYGLIPDRILTSPVVRARQTARLVARQLGDPVLTEEPWLACGMAPATCLTELATHSSDSHLMLVGHEPDFSDTIAHLLGLTNADALHIRKASLTTLDLPELRAGAGRLEYLVPARLM
jgi:phosphohistidine phosphatase